MSREPRQGRGRNSLSPQRSPDELAALLASMADATGDPKPRSARAERPGGLPSAFPPPVVTRRPKAQPAAKGSPAAVEIADKPVSRPPSVESPPPPPREIRPQPPARETPPPPPAAASVFATGLPTAPPEPQKPTIAIRIPPLTRPNGKAKRETKPPSRSSSTNTQPTPMPDRTQVQPIPKPDRTEAQPTPKPDAAGGTAGNGLIAGTPISQASGAPARSPRAGRGASRVGRRSSGSIRRGDRPKRAEGDAPAEPRPRSRASGRIGGAGRNGGARRSNGAGRIGAASGAGRASRLLPAQFTRRGATMAIIGLIAIVLVALVLFGGSSNSPTPAGSKPTPIPVSAPAGATTPATPAATPTAPTTSTSATTAAQPAAGASTKPKAKPKRAVHKAKPAAHKTAPAAQASTPAASSSSGSTTASSPPSHTFTPAPVYRAPAPPPPARQALTGAGSLSSGAGSLTQRRTRHRKH
jgi:hypothetical protein